MPRKPTRFDLKDYARLVKLLKERRMELKMTCEQVDRLAGVQSGYTAKLEMWTPGDGMPAKSGISARTMGIVSMPLIMTALGMTLMAVKGKPPAHYRRGPAGE